MEEESTSIINNIHFVYVGRLKDGRVLLSTLTNNLMQSRFTEFQNYAQLLIKRQASSVTTDNQRLKSEQGGFSWHSFCDKNSIIFGAVTSLDYQDQLSSQFLRQLQKELYECCSELNRDPQSEETANELNGSGKYKMLIHELQGRYREGSTGKTSQVMGTLDKVTGLMKNNLNKIIDNRQQMFDIENKSGDIRDTASRFRTQGHRLEKMAKVRQMQMKIVMGVMIAMSFVLIYYLFF